MKVLLDMNLSPQWTVVFERYGWQTVHWSMVGDPRATDRVIIEWARPHQYVVFTHDLDFGILLAVTHADGPSVIQVRAQDVLPVHLEEVVVAAMRQYGALLEAEALMVEQGLPRISRKPIPSATARTAAGSHPRRRKYPLGNG